MDPAALSQSRGHDKGQSRVAVSLTLVPGLHAIMCPAQQSRPPWGLQGAAGRVLQTVIIMAWMGKRPACCRTKHDRWSCMQARSWPSRGPRGLWG